MTNSIDMSFISDDTLRSMILRDLSELDLCLKNGLYKSALILSGSIIEAILVDYFLAFSPPNGRSPEEIKNAKLVSLIDWAVDPRVKLISETAKNIATVIREYRNLIHPGVEYRKQMIADKNKATVAESLVRIIIEEISINYYSRLGYTCEQAIKKIDNDLNSRSLFDHMISTMSNIERIKLYKRIPLLNYIETFEDNEFIDKTRLNAYIELHSKLKSFIPQEVKKTEAMNLYRSISESSAYEIFLSLRFFADDIDLIEPDKREAIIDYIISLLENSNDSVLQELNSYRIFSAIGKFLNTHEDFEKIKMIFLQRMFEEDIEILKFLEAFKSVLTDIEGKYVDPFLTDLINNEYELDTKKDEFDVNIGIWAKDIEDERSIPF